MNLKKIKNIIGILILVLVVLNVESLSCQKTIRIRAIGNSFSEDAQNAARLAVKEPDKITSMEKFKLVSDTQNWRSALYPTDWQPGFTDSEGRFLHDFSYAGYHSGLSEIPFVTKNLVDVTKKPYKVDNTGKKDVTKILQKAIDDLAKLGGGVLYLPAGEYLTSVSEEEKIGLNIASGNIVIRGAGPQKTFIKNSSTLMRQKTLIWFGSPNGAWNKSAGKQVRLSQDILLPTTIIPVEDVKSFKKGDLVIIKTDVTSRFREEHKVDEHWDKLTRGLHFFREIVSIDEKNNTVEIDVPTRYFMKLSDNARMYVAPPQISECGIEDLSIGNVEQQNYEGWSESDWNIKGTGSYDAHGSHLIQFRNAYNCWARNVHTYRPKENKLDVHTLSNCFRISDSRFITVERCNFQKSQGEGGGGNGYMYTLEGNDCLLTNCYAEDGRHNYSFKNMNANGNVIHNCYSKNPYLATDFHMYLSMSNLIDCFVSDGDYIDARCRSYGFPNSRHMYSTTQTVMWNTTGLKSHSKGMLINSIQFGNGYVIGTSGTMSKVVTRPVVGTERNIQYDTSPEDWVEGEGKGNMLEPQSLYLDQLKKRKERLKNNLP